MSAPRSASALSFPVLPLLQASPVSDAPAVPSLELLSYSAPVLLPSLAVPLFSVLLFQSFVPSLAVRSEPLSSLRSSPRTNGSVRKKFSVSFIQPISHL